MDEASLNLLQGILTDADLKHFMFVGSYRDNEVGEEHALTIKLREIVADRSFSTVQVGNLQRESVNQLLSDLLKQDLEETRSLAETVCRKTYGNVFFMIGFLSLLARADVLFRSLESYNWS